MKPMLLAKTNRPFKHPASTSSLISEKVKAPLLRSMSTKHSAMQPSTFRMSSRHLLHAKGKIEHLGGTELRQCIVSNTVHTLVWIRLTLMRWPMPIIRILFFLQSFTNCLCDTSAPAAFVNMLAASSNAPPQRGPMQSKPDHKVEIKSLPAQDATTVLCAPDTAGP